MTHVFSLPKYKNWQDQQASFMQSKNYADLLMQLGRTMKAYRIQTEDNSFFVQGIENTDWGGIRYIYFPLIDFSQEAFDALLQHLQKEGYHFVRLEGSDICTGGQSTYKRYRVKNRQTHYSWHLDLTQSLEDLQASFHKKTRYNIRLAQKKGVSIRVEKNIDAFWPLFEATGERNKFWIQPKSYCQKVLACPSAIQATAYLGEKAIASAIFWMYQGQYIYLLGASSSEYRSYMAPYLLHWHMMQLAKEEGAHTYDWWGIAGPSIQADKESISFHGYTWNKQNPLHGVTRFKAGFGGSLMSYADAMEIPFNQFRYQLYRPLSYMRSRHVVGH